MRNLSKAVSLIKEKTLLSCGRQPVDRGADAGDSQLHPPAVGGADEEDEDILPLVARDTDRVAAQPGPGAGAGHVLRDRVGGRSSEVSSLSARSSCARMVRRRLGVSRSTIRPVWSLLKKRAISPNVVVSGHHPSLALLLPVCRTAFAVPVKPLSL